MSTVKEQPILMSAPMVRATLREVDPKTQTRRVIKPQPQIRINVAGRTVGKCPYGQVGERLWVREAWRRNLITEEIYYRADGYSWRNGERRNGGTNPNFKPSSHMPRRASRITLEITGIRVERVQDISVADCHAEGMQYAVETPIKHQYARLWDSLNAKRGYSWAVNPWVWIIEFKRLEVTP